jgi:hypothetical protein
MSTSAIYSFRPNPDDTRGETHHVYKHDDGSPSDARDAIEDGMRLAWPLPRFEPDEAAAAFIAANKHDAGGVRTLPSGPWQEVAPASIEYRYEISMVDGKIQIRGWNVMYDCTTGEWAAQDVSGYFILPLWLRR